MCSPQCYAFPYIPTNCFLLLNPTNTWIQRLLQLHTDTNVVPLYIKNQTKTASAAWSSLSARNHLNFGSFCMSKCVRGCYNVGFRLSLMHLRQHTLFSLFANASLQLQVVRRSVFVSFYAHNLTINIEMYHQNVTPLFW